MQQIKQESQWSSQEGELSGINSMVSVVIGAQWGDEGKGKIMDLVSQSSDYVVRFHGGNNAGHTVINKYGTFPLHLIPSGIFAKKAKACITNGTVLNLEVLLDEIDMLNKAGFKLENRLIISPRCHIILPYHKLLDGLSEKVKGDKKVGTTGRGIGPVHADKVSYQGIRLVDLVDKKQFSEKLAIQLTLKNAILKAFGEKPLDQKEIEKSFFAMRTRLLPYIKEPFPVLHKALKKKKSILLEGAQGMFLDNDWGTYPYVTASNMIVGNANAAAGLPPQSITSVIGVVKAYTTRVGEGPFPTELFDKDGEKLQAEGKEFGVTTGRARRCGWFDAELIRFAAQINGFTQIALTKIDILDNFEEIKICIGYTLNGEKVNYYDGDAEFLKKVKPVYKTMKGWMKPINKIKKFDDLPTNAQKYIKELEKLIGVKISIISVGPARTDTITR